jgi:micrococcal nuclease
MFEYAVQKIEKVVDGDTIDITVDLGFSMFTKQRVRLIGIDTPESNSKDETERKLALEAKDYAIKWFVNHPNLAIRTTKDDKYGRILGEFFATGQTESLNAQMVRLGYAWAYDGGTKHKDFTQLLEKRTKIL